MPEWRERVEVLIDSKALQRRVAELGSEIASQMKGADLVLVGVLKGSFLFMADLCRQIDLPLRCDFLGVSSYQGHTRTSGIIRITSDLSRPIEGKDVLLVEDIVDTGLTMRYLLDNLATRRPRSLKVCSLLDKPARRRVKVDIDFRGFEVPDVFVVGYGLDYMGLYRNLDFIGRIRDLEQ
ncbi:MAG: hypoxanthine phosphoribosyltransferase [Deltaproteobacteria bacterium]|nr:MAG: hypoxanthine phosphoribosyltransferase [Deltaproteobacteria bacterium]